MSLEQAWYQNAAWLRLLRPVSLLFRRPSQKRRIRLQAEAWYAPVPVIIVGNISVGGSGKTPLTLALIEQLQAAGLKPGIVSRGYGAKPPETPYLLTQTSLCEQGGDEPCLIQRRTQVPVVVDPDRVSAVKALLEHYDCDCVISDDGMQHYRLGRDIELCVIDGRRGFGNQQTLPEGPLRESVARLDEVDAAIVNGQGASLPNLSVPAFNMQLAAHQWLPLDRAQTPLALNELPPQKVHAFAGIGDPSRFFKTLEQLGFEVIGHPLADHADIDWQTIHFDDELPILCTEKDWVKLQDKLAVGPQALDLSRYWALSVDAELPAEFAPWLIQKINEVKRNKAGAS